MKTAQDLIAEAKASIREVTAEEVMAMQQRGESFTLLDVRDQPEVALTSVPGALHISRGTLEGKVEAAVSRDTPVIILCASGNRSALAAVTLQQMGYRDVASMRGGIRAWAEAGGEID